MPCDTLQIGLVERLPSLSLDLVVNATSTSYYQRFTVCERAVVLGRNERYCSTYRLNWFSHATGLQYTFADPRSNHRRYAFLEQSPTSIMVIQTVLQISVVEARLDVLLAVRRTLSEYRSKNTRHTLLKQRLPSIMIIQIV